MYFVNLSNVLNTQFLSFTSGSVDFVVQCTQVTAL